MSESDARSAYYSFAHDLRASFKRDGYNANAEIAEWEEVRNTLNRDQCTFHVRVWNLRRMSLAAPTGSGYQVMLDLSEFHTPTTSPLRHSKETDTIIAAPSLIDGTYVLSYRFSVWRFVRAWLVYLALLVVRFALIALLVAVVAAVVWYVPWSTWSTQLMTIGLNAYEAFRATPTPPPPAPPATHTPVFASRPVVGGP